MSPSRRCRREVVRPYKTWDLVWLRNCCHTRALELTMRYSRRRREYLTRPQVRLAGLCIDLAYTDICSQRHPIHTITRRTTHPPRICPSLALSQWLTPRWPHELLPRRRRIPSRCQYSQFFNLYFVRQQREYSHHSSSRSGGRYVIYGSCRDDAARLCEADPTRSL